MTRFSTNGIPAYRSVCKHLLCHCPHRLGIPVFSSDAFVFCHTFL